MNIYVNISRIPAKMELKRCTNTQVVTVRRILPSATLNSIRYVRSFVRKPGKSDLWKDEKGNDKLGAVKNITEALDKVLKNSAVRGQNGHVTTSTSACCGPQPKSCCRRGEARRCLLLERCPKQNLQEILRRSSGFLAKLKILQNYGIQVQIPGKFRQLLAEI